jgi:hypothetical protein
VKNCIVLLHGINFFSFKNFVYVINLKHKSCSLVPNGMLVVSAIFVFAGEVLRSKLVYDTKCLCKTLLMKNMKIVF